MSSSTGQAAPTPSPPSSPAAANASMSSSTGQAAPTPSSPAAANASMSSSTGQAAPTPSSPAAANASMSASTGQAAPTASPSSPAVANAAPPAATTVEPKMDAGLLAMACSGSFHDLESLLNGTPAAYAIGSSATRPPSLYAVTVGGDNLLHVVVTSHGDSEDSMRKASLVNSKASTLLFLQNNEGDTPLHCAARAGNFPMVSLLIGLANGQGVNNAKGLLETQNKLKETALHEAVRFGSNDIVELLMENPQLARFPEEGTSPLYLAVLLENKIIAETLHELSNGDLSYSGPNGRNALHVAVQRRRDLTKMLLNWNSDLMLQGDKNGSTPLHFAIVATLWKIPSQVLTTIPDALYQQDLNGSFPIHVAASVGATWIITSFLMKLPNCADLRDARGRTFLHVAVDRNYIEVVKYVCQNISLSWILNMQDKDGNTALHLAVKKGCLRMFCSLFSNRQVQLNLMNGKGKTPLDTAHGNLPNGTYMTLDNEAQILKVLKYVGAKRGIVHQGFLNEYDIDQARQREIRIMNQVKEGTQSRVICSVLIATVTFGAAFTMPGGYRADDHFRAGSPTLAGAHGFSAFIVTNTIAFTFSTASIMFLMLSGTPTLQLRSRQVLLGKATVAMVISVVGMIYAFLLGTYMMLGPVAPTLAVSVHLIVIQALVIQCQSAASRHNVVFAALRKRNGIWYGIVWAYPFAIVLFVCVVLVFLPAFLFGHTGGKVEQPAQPPTPFA